MRRSASLSKNKKADRGDTRKNDCARIDCETKNGERSRVRNEQKSVQFHVAIGFTDFRCIYRDEKRRPRQETEAVTILPSTPSYFQKRMVGNPTQPMYHSVPQLGVL